MHNGRIKLLEIVNHLQSGGVIIYPTETSYGLGCDATNKEAVGWIFKIKKRSKQKSLPIIVASLIMAEKYAHFSTSEKKIAKKFWPGPLTLVLPQKNKRLAKGITAKDGTVALRVSANSFARGITQKLGQPIVSTSANISGKKEIYFLAEVKKNFPNLAKYNLLLIDGGRLPKRKSSTIIKMKGEKIEVLRKGEISFKNYE